jgi:hypothetical protein
MGAFLYAHTLLTGGCQQTSVVGYLERTVADRRITASRAIAPKSCSVGTPLDNRRPVAA